MPVASARSAVAVRGPEARYRLRTAMARTAWETQYPVAICDTAARGGRLSVPALTSHPSPQPQGREGPVCGAHHWRSKSSQHILPVAFSANNDDARLLPGALAEKAIHRIAWKRYSQKFACRIVHIAPREPRDSR